MESSRISGNGCLAKICWQKDQFSGQMLLQNVEHHKFYPFYFQIPYVLFTALAMAASVAMAPCVARPMLLSGEKKMPLTDWWSKLEGGTAGWHRECEWHGTSPSLFGRCLLNWILKWWWLPMCDFYNHEIISWTTTFEMSFFPCKSRNEVFSNLEGFLSTFISHSYFYLVLLSAM